MKKVGENTRPFRHDINQIPHDYTVTNRFKGFDLLGRMTEKPWKEVSSIVQEVLTEIIKEEKTCKKSKWLSEEALQVAEKRSES